MNRNEFIDKLYKSDSYLDKTHISEILNRSIDYCNDNNPKGHMNLIITMEEMSELTKEISKELRGKGNYYDILQELADVCVCIGYIRNIFNIDDESLHKAINIKINRLENFLNGEDYE